MKYSINVVNVEVDGVTDPTQKRTGCSSWNTRVCVCAFPSNRKLHPPLVFELLLTGSLFQQTRPSFQILTVQL